MSAQKKAAPSQRTATNDANFIAPKTSDRQVFPFPVEKNGAINFCFDPSKVPDEVTETASDTPASPVVKNPMTAGLEALEKEMHGSGQHPAIQEMKLRLDEWDRISKGRHGLPVCPEIPYNSLPPIVADLVRSVEKDMGFSPHTGLCAVLGIAAACARKNVTVHVNGGWKEHPNLWMWGGEKVGGGKSTLISALSGGLKQYHTARLREYKEDSLKVATDGGVIAEKLKGLGNALRKEIQNELPNTKHIEEQIAELNRAKPEKIPYPVDVVEDFTSASLVDALKANADEFIPVVSAEGRMVIGNLAGRYLNGEFDATLVVKTRSGDEHNEIKRGQNGVPNILHQPKTSQLLLFQPDVLTIAAQSESFVASGLMARPLYIIGDSHQFMLDEYGHIPASLMREFDTAMLYLASEVQEQVHLTVSESRRSARKTKETSARQSTGDLSGASDFKQGWYARRESNYFGLVALFIGIDYAYRRAVKGETGEVAAMRGKVAMDMVDGIMPYFEAHTERADALITQSSEMMRAKKITSWAWRNRDKLKAAFKKELGVPAATQIDEVMFTARAVLRDNVAGCQSSLDVDLALTLLSDHGMTQTFSAGSRKSKIWYVIRPPHFGGW